MHHRTSSNVRVELSVFLAEHLGTQQSGDVGALLGQAALMSDRVVADEMAPDGFREAMNAALSAASGAGRESAGANERHVATHAVATAHRAH